VKPIAGRCHRKKDPVTGSSHQPILDPGQRERGGMAARGVHRHAFLPGSGRGRGTAQRGRAARGRPWRGARGETISPGRWLPRTGSKRDEVREPRKGRQSRERPAGLPAGRLRRAGPRTSEKGRGHKLKGGCGGHARRRQAGRGRTLGGRKPRRGSGAPNGLGREGRTGWPCGSRPRGRRPGVWRRASGRAAGRNGEGAAAAERRCGCTAMQETPGGRTPDALAALTKLKSQGAGRSKPPRG
jgi:hypothetical protein